MSYSSIEERLECAHYVNNLRLKYLKLIYYGGSIAQSYGTGDSSVHVHGLWRTDTDWETDIVRFCWT